MTDNMNDRSIELEQEVGDDSDAYNMDADDVNDLLDGMPDVCADCGSPLDLSDLCPMCDTNEFDVWDDEFNDVENDGDMPIIRKMRRTDD